MPKLITVMRRKKGVTRQQFREYYERNHAPFSVECFGHLYADYRRNFVMSEIDAHYDEKHQLESPLPNDDDDADFTYDAIMEITFETQAEMDALFAALKNVREAMAADEDAFIDRTSLRVFRVNEMVSDLPVKAR